MDMWQVKSEGYTESFDSLKVAKRAFGRIKKEIYEEDEADGWVLLLNRKDDKSSWTIYQEFYIGEPELPREVKSLFNKVKS